MFKTENVVATQSGLLLGAFEDGVQVFRGVPYSVPPVGERRFRSPIPIRWEGQRDATRSGSASYQINAGNRERVKAEIAAMDPGLPGDPLWPGYAAETYAQNNASEDCLYVVGKADEIVRRCCIPSQNCDVGSLLGLCRGATREDRSHQAK